MIEQRHQGFYWNRRHRRSESTYLPATSVGFESRTVPIARAIATEAKITL